MTRSIVFLAQGFEEIEALTTVDVLRRAGIEVVTVSITPSLQVTGAHGVTVTADKRLNEADCENAQWLIVPGGMPGSQNLADCQALNRLLLRQSQHGNIAAICAAPALVLAPLGLLQGKDATCYPGMEDHLTGANHIDKHVVVARNGDHVIVTGNGPASAMAFALTIVEEALGHEVSVQVGTGLLVYPKAEDFYFG